MAPSPPISIPSTTLQRRQLWNLPTLSQSSSISSCTPFTLPSGGILTINSNTTITFQHQVVYAPRCTDIPVFLGEIKNATSSNHHPFYASSTPLIYVVAATTIIAWTLFIIVLVAPGATHTAPRPNRSTWLPRAIADPLAVVNAGSRPWLQKLAGLMVTVAMTTVTADAFNVAREQYYSGFSDPTYLRDSVTTAKEVRVIRVISDMILFLAQVQTLIRLFPRHKEKLVIKWVGYLLIILDTVFSCLNGFYVKSTRRPRSYQDAIPALSYLFQLALNLLYAAWVFYYVSTKYRYAFYHPTMPSISVIALLSILAILIPVVFFIADILIPTVGGWGDFFRWVGSAASSIVVWEWVERIESIEREEKKDGILGREIFDGDEMLDHIYSDRISYTARSSKSAPSDSDDSPGNAKTPRKSTFSVTHRLRHFKSSQTTTSIPKRTRLFLSNRPTPFRHSPSILATSPTIPDTVPEPHIISPTDRTTTHSANSTVYAVHYHPITISPPLRNDEPALHTIASPTIPPRSTSPTIRIADPLTRPSDTRPVVIEPRQHTRPANILTRTLATLPFRRSRRSPPIEVKNALGSHTAVPSTPESRRASRANPPTAAVQPTIIPAPPRGHTWSPDLARHSPLDPQQNVPSDSQPPDSAAPEVDAEQGRGSTTRDFAVQGDQP